MTTQGVWATVDVTAGLTGPVLHISPISSGSLTTASNQAISFNDAGKHCTQGHAGHIVYKGTTAVLELYASSSDQLSLGADPSTTGRIRLTYGDEITARNQDDSGDESLIMLTTYNAVNLGNSNARFNATGFGIFEATHPAARGATYYPINVTDDRTFDADATSTAELADVLGTLILDLQKHGVLKGWNPYDDVGGVIAEWLVRLEHITKDGSNNVSQIDDLSGNAVHLTQSGGARPAYQSTGLDSDEAVSFNGSSTWIGSAAAAGIQALGGSDVPFTLALRCSFPTPTNLAAPFGIDGDAASEGRHEVYFNGTTLTIRRDDDASANANAAVDGSAGAAATYVFSFAGTAITVFKDGTKIVNAAALNVGATTLDWITFGAYRPLGLGPLNFSELKFRHAILLDTALSDTDCKHLTNYINRQ